MGYPAPFLALRFGGPLFGVEDWQCGLNLIQWTGGSDAEAGVGEAVSPATPTEVPADVIAALRTFVGGSAMSVAVQLTWAKLNLLKGGSGYPVADHGKYVSNTTTVRWDETGTPAAGTGSAPMPPQCAVAVTLQTIAQRGNASRGRLFVPSPNVAIDPATGLMGAGQVVVYADKVVALINALNAALTEWRVGVVSPGGVRDPNGAQRLVRTVNVGRAVDTQRRRRSDLNDERVASTVAVTPLA